MDYNLVGGLVVWLFVCTDLTLVFRYPKRQDRGMLTRMQARAVHGTDSLIACKLVRLFDLLFVVVVNVVMALGLHTPYWWVPWVPLVVLNVDDLVTGDDDDRWRRRWQAVKNRVRWRMVLPPVPVPTTR